MALLDVPQLFGGGAGRQVAPRLGTGSPADHSPGEHLVSEACSQAAQGHHWRVPVRSFSHSLSSPTSHLPLFTFTLIYLNKGKCEVGEERK